MTVYLRDPDVTLWHGEVLDALRKLPDESVHCVVTSPPYWGLRDYGTGSWEGGDSDCDHVAPPKGGPHTASTLGPKRDGLGPDNAAWADSKRNHQFSDVCGKCGAQRTDQQLGLEPTPDAYIERMVRVFREVRRVLRRDGVCFLNIGDSYLPGKQMAGVPWRLLFALQDDGWIPRADIIWAKLNPMPESVTDRPTKAHEYVFLLTRSPRYFFDQEAVREKDAGLASGNGFAGRQGGARDTTIDGGYGTDERFVPGAGRNVRSVWTIATEPYPEAHFATFPTELARRCILAGTSERGCCPECGAPWVREVKQRSVSRPDLPREHPEWRPSRYDNGKAGDPQAPGPGQRFSEVKTLGWFPSCNHTTPRRWGKTYDALTPVPCTVLDPFVGSGTVPHVARLHNRHAIGIDLNADYLQLAARRLQQQSLFASSSTEGAV